MNRQLLQNSQVIGRLSLLESEIKQSETILIQKNAATISAYAVKADLKDKANLQKSLTSAQESWAARPGTKD